MMEEEEAEQEQEEKEQEIRVQVPYLITEAGIAEEVWDRKNVPLFAVRKFGSSEITYVGEITTDQVDMKGRKIIYVPVDNSHLRKGLVIVPERAESASFDEVYKEGCDLVREMYDYPREKELEIEKLVTITQCSWFLDRLINQKYQIAGMGVFAPIIAIRGRSGSGKNRLLNALRLNAYRPFFDQATVRTPSLYRPMDLWRGTLCLDEADFEGNESSDFVKYLDNRCTGTPIARQDPDAPKFSDAFWNFGLTLVTQRRHWAEDALENRTIEFQSEKTQKDISTVELDDWIERGFKLQNKLLYLRLLYWDKVEINKSARIPGIKDHRLTASVLVVLALGKFAPTVVSDLEKILAEMEKKRRAKKAESTDGILVNTLWDHIEQGHVGVWEGYTYIGERIRKDGKDLVIPVSASELAEQLGWKPRHVRMVFQSLRIGEGPAKIRISERTYRPLWFAHNNLEPLLVDFVVDYEAGTLERILKVNGINVPDVADVAHDPLSSPPENSKEKEIPRESISGTSGTSGTNPEPKTPESSEIAANSSILLGSSQPNELHIKPIEGSIEPARETLCPPAYTTEEWEKMSDEEKERILKGRDAGNERER